MTNAVDDGRELLRNRLEEQFELHTGQLTDLLMGSRRRQDAYDMETAAALTSLSRQALADIAHALRRMAEGTYGTCERCGSTIPPERLEILPHTRFCVSCRP